MNGVCIDPDALKRAGKATAGDLRVDENDDLLERLVFGTSRLEDVDQHVRLLAIRDLKDLLSNRVGRLILTGDFDHERIGLEEVLREPGDVGRERSRKHQTLTVGRQKLEDAADVRQEAHVEHAVSLVEHDDLDLREIRRALLDMVKQTARRRRQNFDAAAEHVGLRTNVDAAVDHTDAQRRVRRILRHVGRDLIGQLARRRQDERAHGMTGGRHRGVRMRKNAGDERETEARRLARARLGCAHHVSPLHHHGNGLKLNRRRLLVADAFDGGHDAGVEIELCER